MFSSTVFQPITTSFALENRVIFCFFFWFIYSILLLDRKIFCARLKFVFVLIIIICPTIFLCPFCSLTFWQKIDVHKNSIVGLFRLYYNCIISCNWFITFFLLSNYFRDSSNQASNLLLDRYIYINVYMYIYLHK